MYQIIYCSFASLDFWEREYDRMIQTANACTDRAELCEEELSSSTTRAIACAQSEHYTSTADHKTVPLQYSVRRADVQTIIHHR